MMRYDKRQERRPKVVIVCMFHGVTKQDLISWRHCVQISFGPHGMSISLLSLHIRPSHIHPVIIRTQTIHDTLAISGS